MINPLDLYIRKILRMRCQVLKYKKLKIKNKNVVILCRKVYRGKVAGSETVSTAYTGNVVMQVTK